ncbi:hypothetical protein ACYF6T_19815 [Streptomyces sp. 7R007]
MTARPAYVPDDALLARARELGKDRFSVAPGGSPEVERQVREAAAAEGLSPGAHLWRKAGSVDVGSPHDGAVFWGYQDPVDQSLECHYVAMAWVERHNRDHPEHPMTTFWTTPGGVEMDVLNRLSAAQWEALGLDPEFPMRLWELMSLRYSQLCSGRVTMFCTHFHPDVLLGRTELPALRCNPAVGPERLHFVHRPPKRLSNGVTVPENVRRIVSEPGNQASLQFYASDRPGFLDVVEAGGWSDDRLRARAAELRAQVRRADQAWQAALRQGPAVPERPAGRPWKPVRPPMDPVQAVPQS